jgi:hypothetical protein
MYLKLRNPSFRSLWSYPSPIGGEYGDPNYFRHLRIRRGAAATVSGEGGVAIVSEGIVLLLLSVEVQLLWSVLRMVFP